MRYHRNKIYNTNFIKLKHEKDNKSVSIPVLTQNSLTDNLIFKKTVRTYILRLK